MSWFKKFWIVFVSFLPLSAGAVAPIVVGLIAGGIGIAGFSIYRSFTPVDMSEAFKFFSTCWTCQLFSDVMETMSVLLPKVFHAIGLTVLPMLFILTTIWFVWKVVTGFLQAKVEDPWSITSIFSVHIIKLVFVSALLVAPLPRMLTDVAIEPIFNIGLSLNRTVSGDEDFSTCIVATAIADPATVSKKSAYDGAYSPRLRHSLACELAAVHQMTGLGMTVGWTMLNMAFDSDYMHKIMWSVPIFPNVPIFFAGLLILVLFLFALLPVPLYFLEVFIKLTMDLIMLPLMLMSWLFSGWPIFPNGGKNIRSIIDDVVSATLGIAMTGIFITFSIMFINAIFGSWNGTSRLQAALDANDSKLLMDGLMMRNDSLVTIILMGLFIAMFMSMIPALVKSLFSVNISQEFYEKAKKDTENIWKNMKKWYSALKK